MLKYDHVIFDFDGTLSDSYPSFATAMKTVADSNGINVTRERLYYLLKKYSTKYVFENFGLDAQAKADFKRISEELLLFDAVPIEGTEELLSFIAERGGRSYVYSHSGDVVTANIDRWGLKKYFTDCMLGDARYPRKPAPDALLALLERNGLDPERCIMVGDRDIDILAAKNAGVRGILIDDEGYYPDLIADYRVTELSEIKDILIDCGTDK